MPAPGTGGRPDRIVLLFESTHAAMAAEERIIGSAVWCDVIPRPPGTSDSLCGLAVEIHAEDEEGVSDLLEKSGIAFETYHEDGHDGS